MNQIEFTKSELFMAEKSKTQYAYQAEHDVKKAQTEDTIHTKRRLIRKIMKMRKEEGNKRTHPNTCHVFLQLRWRWWKYARCKTSL